MTVLSNCCQENGFHLDLNLNPVIQSCLSDSQKVNEKHVNHVLEIHFQHPLYSFYKKYFICVYLLYHTFFLHLSLFVCISALLFLMSQYLSPGGRKGHKQ